MSVAAATPPVQPSSDPAAAAPSGRLARVLDLVRKLVDYARELGNKLIQRVPAIELAPHGCNFGTTDTRLILARITQGLLRAQALEARLALIAPRLDAKPKATPSRRKPCATPAPSQANAVDPRLANLPTAEQIAAEVRRRPIGAVIADICRDLGIMPCHPLWHELSRVIMFHGGSLANLVKDIITRPHPPGWAIAMSPAWQAPVTPSSAPDCTGPP